MHPLNPEVYLFLKSVGERYSKVPFADSSLIVPRPKVDSVLFIYAQDRKIPALIIDVLLLSSKGKSARRSSERRQIALNGRLVTRNQHATAEWTPMQISQKGGREGGFYTLKVLT